MRRHAPVCLLLGVALLLTGCTQGTPGSVSSPVPTHTPTIGSTLIPTLTPMPTRTPVPPTPVPSPTRPAPVPELPFQPNGPQGWCWQEGLGLVSPLADLSFVDARTGWAVGEGGAILHTSDGGATWGQQHSPVNIDWERVTFADPQNGWVLGTDAELRPLLLHTDDGGQSWSQQALFSIEAVWVDMTWPDSQTAWLTADTGIWHTADGGESWQEQPYPSPYVIESVTSVDAQHAWITTGFDILRTTDGGRNWAGCYSGTLWWKKLVFVDSQVGWGIAQDGTVVHTTDGGHSWETQYQEEMANGWDIDFLDAQNGWALGINVHEYLLVTTDGGKSWQKRTVPTGRMATTFVDPQHGWTVGYPGWWPEPRHSIAYTEDGGQNWQLQDTNIAMPSLATAAADRFSALLQQPNPPLDVLVLVLFPGHCESANRYLVDRALYNLGWDGSQLNEPPQERKDLAVDRLDGDMDGDGEQEAVLYGGNGDDDLFLSVLDRNEQQWQLAWTENQFSWYSGNVRATLLDLNDDGQPELQLDWLTHPSKGTGFLEQVWDSEILSCAPGLCRQIWKAELGHSLRACSGYQGWHAWTEWTGREFHLVPSEAGPWLDIQLQQYKAKGSIEQAREAPAPSLEIKLSPSLSQTYQWTGSVYTLTAEAVLTPERVLEVQPVTETLDLDGDGAMEQAVFRYDQDCDATWHILSLYEAGQAEPIGVFTATVTGAPTPSLSLRDVDLDGMAEVVNCSTAFLPEARLAVEWVQFIAPRCEVEEVGWR